MPFRDLGVDEIICAALDDAGIHTTFPIQALTLPLAIDGQDIIGQARTGTGKTLAFGVPMLHRLTTTLAAARAAKQPACLIVVPTRELAIQVAEDLQQAGTRLGARVLTVYGGRAYEPQIEALTAGTDIVVGTPGRLLDLANRKNLDLSQIRSLVLDEADKMLDLGFLPDVEKLLRLTPADRQTMLFSATMPGEVVTLARRHMRRATNIRAEEPDESAPPPLTTQYVYRTHHLDKVEVLARVLQARDRGLTLIFVRTKRSAAKVSEDLADRGFAVGAVHGDLGQSAREQALRAFRSGKIDVLVATDVAARGWDVEGITHVVNYQAPEDEMTYVHRIGRTARAGASGTAVTLVDWDDVPRWKLICDKLDLPFHEPVETYSTSPHLAIELDIPEGVTGVLPRANRTREGLDAEQVEDLGGREPSRSGGRERRGSGPRERARPDRPRSTRTRSRTRTRGGQSADGDDAAPASSGTASDAASADDGA
ncbi:MAG: DEAD/DEAH box helicase, partial [Jatrophihabitantaceae bacterium]